MFIIMQVCKQWHLAATTKNHFWKRHIDDALNSWIVNHNIETREYVQAVRMFDTFSSPVQETLREQVEWIFKQESWLQVRHAKPKPFIVIRRHTFVNTGLQNSFCIALPVRLLVVALRDVEADFKDKKTGRFISKRVNPAHDISGFYTIWVNVPSGNNLLRKGLGKVVFPQFGTFEGEIMYDGEKNSIQAHNNGKWILNDGTILEGAGVAYRNEPRFILTEQKWPLLKRQKTE